MSDQASAPLYERIYAITSNRNLTPSQKLIAIELTCMSKDEGEGCCAWPSVPTLVKRLGMNEDRVRRNIRFLEKEKILKRDYRSGASTVYRLVEPGGEPKDCIQNPRANGPTLQNAPSRKLPQGGVAKSPRGVGQNVTVEYNQEVIKEVTKEENQEKKPVSFDEALAQRGVTRPPPKPSPVPEKPRTPPGTSAGFLEHKAGMLDFFDQHIWPLAKVCNRTTPGRHNANESRERFLCHCTTVEDMKRLAAAWKAMVDYHVAGDKVQYLKGLQVFIGPKGSKPDWKFSDIVGDCEAAMKELARRKMVSERKASIPDYNDEQGWLKLGRSVGISPKGSESWGAFRSRVRTEVMAA